jgi:hypothetical protein
MKNKVMLFILECVVVIILPLIPYSIFKYMNNNHIDTLSYFCGVSVMIVINVIIDVFNFTREEMK